MDKEECICLFLDEEDNEVTDLDVEKYTRNKEPITASVQPIYEVGVGEEFGVANKTHKGLDVIPLVREEIRPQIGQKFQSLDEAYNFYNIYARMVGFSVRKGSVIKDKKDGSIKNNQFCCSKQGIRDPKRVGKNKSGTEKHPIKRVGCEAFLEVKRMLDNKFEIIKFVEEHNHEMQTPTKSNLHRSQKFMDDESKRFIERWPAVGLRPRKIYDVLSDSVGGHDKLPITEDDVRRHVLEVSKRTYGKEANTVLNYFRNKTRDDPNFFYSIQVNDESQLCNCFWVDGKSRSDYRYFGDVVVFDTTYKTNKFLMSFAPITGVNNHRQSILFGCALLVDESQASFEWLFEEWLRAMGDGPPNAIITDQDIAMENAIAKVMPNTCHRYCKWHILQKFPDKIPRLASNEEFKRDFKQCLYESESPEEFELQWNSLTTKYDLFGVTWLNELYNIREKWLQVYMRDVFFAGMSTTQRSESMNKMFKGYVDKNTSLVKFVEMFDRAINFRRNKETKQDFDTLENLPLCKLGLAIEEHMRSIFTRKIFKSLQKELFESLKFVVLINEKVIVEKYEVFLEKGVGKRYKVSYVIVEEKAYCSCGRYEFEGIVCRHIFSILKLKFKTELPMAHIMKRWTRDAKISDARIVHNLDIRNDLKTSMTYRFNEACFWFNQVAKLAASSENTFDYAMKKVKIMEGELMMILKEDEAIEVETEDITRVGELTLHSLHVLEGNESQIMCSRNDISLLDPNIVKSKGSGKRFKSAKEMWSKKTRSSAMHTSEGKPQRTCHNCTGHGHDSRNCPIRKKSKSGTLNLSGSYE